MTDTQKLVGHIASLLQAAGRDKLTEEEWARIDQRVADARADAVAAAG